MSHLKPHSQNWRIMRHLSAGKTLTPLSALRLFDALRLGARVYELKRRGWDIKRKMITLQNNKRVAQYRL